jgi:hypothetical protein
MTRKSELREGAQDGDSERKTLGRSHKGYDFDDTTGAIIGACIDVHESLGPGFRQITYQRALALEL